MPPLEHLVAAVMGVALAVYLLTGGADFGGGVWHLLAGGPRKDEQQRLIRHAIGPIWEANHVWLILVVVLLFACFPKGFALISTMMHVPLSLMLVGIVVRGSAFVFESYGLGDALMKARFGRAFALASLFTPVMMGIVVGTVSSGAIPARAAPHEGLGPYLWPWLAPFPLAVGGLTLALCALLAAVYLCVEAHTLPLQEDFRRRALAAAVGVGALALLCLALAGSAAPAVAHALTLGEGAGAFHGVTAVCATSAMVALYRRRYRWARALVVLQACLILAGWGAAQLPWLIPPHLTLTAAATHQQVLRVVLLALAAGSVLLLPAFIYLFVVFKGARAQTSSQPQAGSS